jgi:hypothetical protein
MLCSLSSHKQVLHLIYRRNAQWKHPIENWYIAIIE